MAAVKPPQAPDMMDARVAPQCRLVAKQIVFGASLTTMKKLLTLATLLAASTNAFAEWQRLDTSFPGVDLYVNHETVGKSADRRIQIYHILDYKSPQQKNGDEFRSEMLRHEYACNKGEYHVQMHTWHKGPMGSDKMVHFSEGSWYWTKPDTGSVEEALLRAVCSVY